MTENIIAFPGRTTIDLPATKVLDAAKDTEFDALFVVGITQEGRFYLAATTSDMATLSLLHRRMGGAIDTYLEEIMG